MQQIKSDSDPILSGHFWVIQWNQILAWENRSVLKSEVFSISASGIDTCQNEYWMISVS